MSVLDGGGHFQIAAKCIEQLHLSRCSTLRLAMAWDSAASEPATDGFRGPFQRGGETHRERTGIVPTSLIRIQQRPIRNDRVSHQLLGLPSNAQFLFWHRAGAFHLQAPAEVQAARPNASQDATRRSPEARSSTRADDPRAPRAPAPRRARRGSRSPRSARRA